VSPVDEAPQPSGEDPPAPLGYFVKVQAITEPRAFGQPADVAPPREILLQQLAQACRRASEAAAPATDILQTEIDRLLQQAFTPDERITLADIQRLADEGLAVAMTERRDGAASRFLRANRVLEESALEPKARSLAESLLWGREAESETRAGRYEWAAELMEAAFERDLAAEDAGLELLLGHRVRLAHARLRLDKARGRLGEALLLGAGLLQYLERPGEAPCDSLRPVWRQGWRDHRGVIEVRLAAELHRQIAEDQVALLAELEAKDMREAAVELRRFSPDQASQISHWTQFQIARLEGDETRRNEAARAVLTAGLRPSAPLCVSVAEAMQG
jgi:hypothetical protein